MSSLGVTTKTRQEHWVQGFRISENAWVDLERDYGGDTLRFWRESGNRTVFSDFRRIRRVTETWTTDYLDKP